LTSSVPQIKLIGSDLDGTLLFDHHFMSPRVKAAVAKARAAGIVIASATGRQVRDCPPSVTPEEVPYAVASNGAIGYDFVNRELLFAHQIETDAVAGVVHFLKDRFPQLSFASVQRDGTRWLVEEEYLRLAMLEDFYKKDPWFTQGTLAELCAEPSTKITARHPGVKPLDMLAALAEAQLPGCSATISGAPFIEVGPPGVTKATGLAQLAALLGIESAQVAAVGDALNDLAMIEWAGFGVAMGNSMPEVLAAADFVTASSDEDGLAVLIDLLLTAIDQVC
jgi:Cof subfamily protein (haloacid dehalogenase superfamily)